MGFKARYNKITVNASNGSVVFDDASSSTWLLGPSLKLSYKRLFAGVTWLNSIDRYSLAFVSIPSNETASTQMSVSDVDALAGFMFHPRFGIFAGYKSITSNSTPNLGNEFNYTLKGPAVGATGNVPLGKLPMLFVFNAGYVFADQYNFLERQNVDEEKADGYSLEIGFTYEPFRNTALFLGLKHQEFESDLGDEWRSLGLTFSGDYRF